MVYVIEFDKRPDGIVNTSITARSTFASGLSLYYDRYSKLCLNVDFVSASIMMVDEDLNVKEQATVQTQYQEE